MLEKKIQGLNCLLPNSYGITMGSIKFLVKEHTRNQHLANLWFYTTVGQSLEDFHDFVLEVRS